MGYILPITPYSYGNYHKRVMKKRNNTYHIGRKHPVTFQETLSEAESESMSLSKFYMREKQSFTKKEQQNHIQDRTNSWQKGQQVNMKI